MHLTIFQWYLIGINIAAFGLYTADLCIFKKTGKEIRPQGLLKCATTFGGALGTLIASLIWDRKLNKINMMSRIYTIFWLVLQGILVFSLYGPNKEQTAALCSAFYHDHKILCLYLAGINAVTFIAFAIDKIKAMNEKWRIREVVLLGLALIGGAAGGLLAMDLCNHKVKSTHFMNGVPLMIILHLILIICWGMGVFA